MPPDEPLRANNFHEEYFASMAARAETVGRFIVQLRRAGEPVPGDGPISASSFDPAFHIVLDAARECRVFGITDQLKRDKPGAPEAWLERYSRSVKSALDVDLSAAGVRDDLAAWWWLAMHADLVLACDASALDTARLFSLGDVPMIQSGRGSRAALRAYARAQVAHPGRVVIEAYAAGTFWSVTVMAAPGLVGQLAREALLRAPLPPSEAENADVLDLAILGTMEASTFWSGGIYADNFEKTLASTLRRGEKYPEIPRDAIRALAAAEGVAIAEQRGLPTPPDGMAQLVSSWAIKLAAESDPLSEATIELAERAVRAVADAGVSERERWTSEEARTRYRAEIEGLRKRLQAALAARRTRARAPNAVPVVPMREIPTRPLKWKSSGLHLMLDDAVALIGSIRDETGARPLIAMKDLTFRELTTDWDAREILSSIRGCPFDEQSGDWSELKNGTCVRVWWPDVSPRPIVQTTTDGWSVAGWGFAELNCVGATPEVVFQSEWSYPTGRELKEDKFAGAGPWRDVDWGALRRKTKAVMRLMTGPLGGVAGVDMDDTLTMPTAAANVRAGTRRFAGRW